jgi:hypothetical protein
MTKTTGDPVYIPCPIIENKVRIVITNDISSAHGKTPCKIQFIDKTTGGIIETNRFHLLIDENVYRDSMVVNTSTFTELQNQTLQVLDMEDNYQSLINESETKFASLDASIDKTITMQNELKLTADYIAGTKQVPTFNSDDSLQKMQHIDNQNAILREDVFTYNGDLVIETRTLNTGEHITITYNLSTYETSIS